jgi:Phage derived protein Gp49-like (DUF891)
LAAGVTPGIQLNIPTFHNRPLTKREMPDLPNLAWKGMDDKTIVWIGSSRDDVRRFPKEAQRKAGYQLRLVQQGKEPDDFKPMPSVGPGAYEIRVQLGDA